FASGCHNSHYFHGQCIVYDGEERRRTPEGRVVLREVLVPAGEFRIVETWDVGGLRGSGSHDVAVDGVFVPDERVTDVTGGLRAEYALYRMPLIARLSYNKVGVALGIARAALDDFAQLAAAKTPRLARAPL